MQQLKLMLKYITSNSSTSSMDTLRIPDDSHLHKVSIEHKQIEIRFRYFSPQKHQQSNVSNNTNLNDKASGSYYVNYSSKSSAVQNQITISRQPIDDKVLIDPRCYSDKFYSYQMAQIKYLDLQYFEDFHSKLLKKAENKHNQKSIKLKLTHPKTKQPDHNQNPNIKRVQISLISNNPNPQPNSPQKKPNKNPQQKPHTTRISRFMQEKTKNTTNSKIVIKLYQQNKEKEKNNKEKEKEEGYITPRDQSHSRRKGITVYSSASTKKNSIQDVVIRNDCNLSVHNVSTGVMDGRSRVNKSSVKKLNTNMKSNGVRGSLRQRYGSQFVQDLRKRAQETKKRVYSKSKLTKKSTPVRPTPTPKK